MDSKNNVNQNSSFNSLNDNSNNDKGLFFNSDQIFTDNVLTNRVFFDNQEKKNTVIEVEFNNKDDNSMKVKNKNSFINLITNRVFLLVIIILVLVFTSITVGKTIYLRSIVDSYEEFFTVIEEKQSSETIIYNGGDTNDEDVKAGAATELVNCLKTPLNIGNIPDSISSIVDEINEYYNQSNNYFAFKYKDIYTGFSISYNENQQIFVASTIKAPKDIYLYEMASLGKVNLDDTLTYTSRYYNTGSGFLKTYGYDKDYTVRELLMYSTVYSDNAAHNMLMDKYGRTNMLSFWKEKGANAIFTTNNNWGVTNAHDASIYMEELYNFYIENDEYGEELMNNFINARPKFISGKNNYKVANKSGWSGSAIHDVSIVFADNPYIVVALSNLGETDYYMSYFNKANDFAYRLHTEYWKYKMEVCGDISQY